MTHSRLLLATVSALSLSATAALADNNEAWLDQSGTANTALINQSGTNNDAGSMALAIRQVDQRNQLTILQSGSDNAVGLGVNPDYAEDGIYQISNRDGVNGNIIDIEQSSDGNTIGAVAQSTSDTNTNLQRNTVNISQAGAGGNTVGSVTQWRQSSRGNLLEVTQTGANNTLARVLQVSPTAGGGNNRNEAFVNQSGTNNGNGILTGAAALSGATSSTIIQGDFTTRGSRNFVNLVVSGDTNQFGVTQYGDLNTVGTLSISGNDNEVGTFQSGNSNVITVTEVDGEGNNIGVAQIGNANTGGVDVSGNFNGLWMNQVGNDNNAMAMITGDNNGLGLSFSGSSPAAAAAGLAPSGLIEQLGDVNTASLTISGNSNAFALMSHGNNNTIIGDVSGDNNQAAVMQVGNTNNANFTQLGAGNNAGIMQ